MKLPYTKDGNYGNVVFINLARILGLQPIIVLRFGEGEKSEWGVGATPKLNGSLPQPGDTVALFYTKRPVATSRASMD